MKIWIGFEGLFAREIYNGLEDSFHIRWIWNHICTCVWDLHMHCQLFHTNFNCTSYELHMKYIWIYPAISVKFIWSTSEVCMKFTRVFLYNFFLKLTTSALDVHLKLIRNSDELHTELIWIICTYNTCEIHMKASCNDSYSIHTMCVWTACEVHMQF